jgi:hypothetical protein
MKFGDVETGLRKPAEIRVKRDGFTDVVEFVRGLNVTETFNELRAKLEHMPDYENSAEMRRLALELPQDIYLAGSLLDLVTLEYKDLKEARESIFAEWREQALDHYQGLKNDKKLSKQISDGMLEDYGRGMEPDRWVRIKEELATAKMVQENAEKLYDALKTKGRHVRSALESLRAYEYYRASVNSGTGFDD